MLFTKELILYIFSNFFTVLEIKEIFIITEIIYLSSSITERKPSHPTNNFFPFGVIEYNVILIGLRFNLIFGISFPSTFPSSRNLFSSVSLIVPETLKIFPLYLEEIISEICVEL